MASSEIVAPADIEAAAARLEGRVWHTPVERSLALSERTGAEVWLKCECFQATGSFKLRGALNRLLTLSQSALARGVITASAGNHGLGVAEAATRLGLAATVVVPETASPAKLRALENYAARGIALVRFGAGYDAAEAHALELASTSQRTYVSAYNDPAVIAGGGTVALEALQDVPEADVLVVPAGGGGLIGGVGVWARHARPTARVVGVQPETSPALLAALQAGRLVTVPVGATLADGLAGNIEAGSITYALAQRVVDKVVLVSEAEIAGAMRWVATEHHILVEGSAATTVAALLADRIANLAGRRVVLLLTGRNVAYDTLRAVLMA
ncbi:MAG TPA: threonine/serine dehydratase [Ktedonobacterales bacterium]|jgi:threonine dehydratase